MQTASVIDVAAAVGDQPSAAIANGSVTSGKTNGLAIGNFASSGSNQSIAIGYYSVATATEADPALPATAVGAGANATGQSTVALGLLAQATSGSTTALGAKSVASEDAAVAVGYGTKATGNYASALGADATASNMMPLHLAMVLLHLVDPLLHWDLGQRLVELQVLVSVC